MQREVARDLRLELPARERARDVRALERNLRILRRHKDYLPKLLVDNLLLLFREHVARLHERVSTDRHLECGRGTRAGRELRLARKIARGYEVVVPLEPEQPAREGPHHESALAGVEPVAGGNRIARLLNGGSTQRSEIAQTITDRREREHSQQN